jgi:hypothetical protein
MKPTELLEVLLKAIGFWSLVSGIAGLPQAISFSHQYSDEQAFILMMADTFAAPRILIVASWLLICATNWLVGLAPSGNNSAVNDQSIKRSRELLGVVLIALGCFDILDGAVRLPYEFARIHHATVRSFDGIAYSGILIAAGCFLVFASDWCARFAYRKSVLAHAGDAEDIDREDQGQSGFTC